MGQAKKNIHKISSKFFKKTNINTPTVIPWGQTDKQTNKRMHGQIFTQYSGISSHSMGARIFIRSTDFLFDPRVNHIFLLDATLHKQLISESIHGSSPMISDICPWLMKKFDFSMNALYMQRVFLSGSTVGGKMPRKYSDGN